MKIRGVWRLKKTWAEVTQHGIILMYHRVANLSRDPWQINVTPNHFNEHMQVLKKYGRPVQVSKVGKHLKRFSFGKKKIVVTFDDGYADNFHNAKPILERHEIPATFFIVSGAIDSRIEFWWDELDRIIFDANAETFERDIADIKFSKRLIEQAQKKVMNHDKNENGIPGNSQTLTKSQIFYYALWELMGALSVHEKPIVLQELIEWTRQASKPRPTYLPMTSQEFMSLAQCPLFEIGAHTVHHPMLTNLSGKEQEEEISRSKRDLENMIGKPITSFSYPHGKYSDETLQIVKRLKFEAACTVVARAVLRSDHQHLLPRFSVLDWNGDQFAENLQKWLTVKVR